jgi:hypothetical protein
MTPTTSSFSTTTTSTTASSSSDGGQHSSILSALDEDALVEVAHAAKAAGALGSLATTSKQLCSLYRSRVPVQLHVYDQEDAALVQRLVASGRPLFSNCTELALAEEDVANCQLAVQLLSGVQGTALQKLWLEVSPDAEQQQQQQEQEQEQEQGLLLDQACYHSTCSVLCLPALQQLHSLSLETGEDYSCCVQQLGLLPRLMHMTLFFTSTGSAEHAPADLTALSRLTTLLELHMISLPPVLPAAGCEGPFSLPSSLTGLWMGAGDYAQAPTIGCWVTHLPGCRQLQELFLTYGTKQHPSAHPSALVPLLVEHTPHLRTLAISGLFMEETDWDAAVPGLADDVEVAEWRPDAALAALTGLECLSVHHMLEVCSAEEWQYMAQLTALTKLSGARIYHVPDLSAVASLPVLELEECGIDMGGYELGGVLLACPLLQKASIYISCFASPVLPPPAAPRLAPHPNLKTLSISGASWGRSDPAAAAAHFARLAPVISGVSDLRVHGWPASSSEAQDAAGSQLPDLCAFTALSVLDFSLSWDHNGSALKQEDLLSMLEPLKQLQCLTVRCVPGLNARAVLVLQHMLPQLQYVRLHGCGQLLPVSGQQQGQLLPPLQAEHLLGKVRQLLRPDLVLVVQGFWGRQA